MTDHKDPLVRRALDAFDDPLPQLGNGWVDVLHRSEQTMPRPARGWPRPRRFTLRSPATVTAGVAVVAAVVALTVVGPWRSGPSLVERAAAAISPTNNSILHIRQTANDHGTVSQTESWLLGDPIKALRITRHNNGGTTDWSIKPTSSGYGGPNASDGSSWVRGAPVAYCQADHTLRTTPDGVSIFGGPIGAIPGSGDPTFRLQAALVSGALRDDGTTQLHGQTVLKFTGALSGLSSSTVTYYAQPTSLLPIRVEWTTGQDPADNTLNSVDFSVAERLPTTPENLALLDVATQHPDAHVIAAIGAATPCR